MYMGSDGAIDGSVWNCDGMRLTELGTAIVRAMNTREWRNDLAETLLANHTSTAKLVTPKAVAHHPRVDAELADDITGSETNPTVLTTIVYSHRLDSMS